MKRFVYSLFVVIFLAVLWPSFSIAQDGPPPLREDRPPGGGPGDRPFFGPGGPGGPGGFGGPNQPERKLVKQFDKDADGRLSKDERKTARDFVKAEKAKQPARRFGPPGGFRGPGNQEMAAPKPGPSVAVADAKSYSSTDLFDGSILRTFFLEFENTDWEAELADFYHTDVEVPATLTVDGKKLANVGVHFRGASSFFTVGEGFKRSMKLSFDFADADQRLYGQKAVDLLNSHEDPTFMHTILYSYISRKYTATPRANFVKLVVNGQSWGIYVSAERFTKEFLKDHYGSAKVARWKVPGSPRGGGGLTYLGENTSDYKKRYEIKGGDDEKSWKAMVNLCKVLNQTPLDQLEKALAPILDIDEALWFLAIEDTLVNNDGYWIRDSDYNIFLDEKGRFHIIAHDMNETFSPPGGPGFRGPRTSDLDPLVGMEDKNKPLRSRLLAVSSLRTRYLEHIRTIAADSLDWNKLDPVIRQYRTLIEKELEADTRKLTSIEAFRRSIDGPTQPPANAGGPPQGPPGFGRGPSMSLKAFVEQRRNYLLNHPEIKKLGHEGQAQK